MKGDPFGAHRVIEPAGALPQAAERLNNDFSRRYDNEIEIAVETLNIDAASFRQMWHAGGQRADAVAEQVLQTVQARGKQHNPVTGSGGMLLGTIDHVGSAVSQRAEVGQRVATLVSLTLTPLHLEEVVAVRSDSDQLDVRGRAVLFESGIFAVLPDDLPERVALSALDVCGAPAQVARGCGPGDAVLILGAGGKSGVLCAAQARQCVGDGGMVIGVENHPGAAQQLRDLEVCDAVIAADATDPLAARQAVLAASGGREADLTVSCVNVEGAELSAVLCTRERGRVFFFAMTTQFTRAALGAEGVGRDVDMLIGNGYARGHAVLTLELLRNHPGLGELFKSRYG